MLLWVLLTLRVLYFGRVLHCVVSSVENYTEKQIWQNCKWQKSHSYPTVMYLSTWFIYLFKYLWKQDHHSDMKLTNMAPLTPFGVIVDRWWPCRWLILYRYRCLVDILASIHVRWRGRQPQHRTTRPNSVACIILLLSF